FLEIEIPRTILLREQPALQPVGEPRDDALEMRELLVEILAQPRKLVGIAEIGRLDLLVEFAGEDLVSVLVVAVLAAPVRPRLAGGAGGLFLALLGEHLGVRALHLAFGVFAGLGFHRLHRGCIGRGRLVLAVLAVALALALLVVLAFLLLLVLARVLVLGVL